MAKVRFHKGLKTNLPSTGLVSGHYYQCTDTGEIFLATSATDLLLVGHGNKVYLPIEGGNITGTLSVKNNEVFHKGNADNASTVWHVKSLDIGSTTAVEHIRFHREGFNYIVAPSASINFASGPAAANTVLHVNIASKRVGVGTTSPKYTLEVGGSFAAESGKIDGNDIYHKGNLVDIPESALDSSVRAKLNQVLFGHLENGQFIKEGESTPVTPAVKTLYVDTTSHSEYVWNATDGFKAIGGGGGSEDITLCDIDDDLAEAILRWPLQKDGIVAVITAYPGLKAGLVAHTELAPYYASAKAVIDENEGLEDSIAAYPILVKIVVENEGLAPILMENTGLDALVAANPTVAPTIVTYPAIAPYCTSYPAIVKSLARWGALAPALLAEPRYIPFLAEDSIIAHSIIDTGKRAWLVGDGSAYINTGLYQLEWPLKVKTNVAYNSTSEMYLGGNYTGSNNGSRVGIASSKHTMYSGSNYQPISTAIVAKQEYAVEYEFAGLTGKKMTIDGAVNENAAAANKVGANNLPFGWFSGKGNAVSNVLNGKISDAYLTIGETTYHYVPAMQGGKYGYLETTTFEFKGNNNTSGSFGATTTVKE